MLGKRIVRAGSGNKKGKGLVRAGYGKEWDFWCFLILSNFEIQKYYRMEPRFNSVSSKNNLPNKIKDGAYIKNLDEYADLGTHWIALFCKRIEIVYFDSFSVEHVPEEIKESVENKNVKANIFWVQANNSIMCGYMYKNWYNSAILHLLSVSVFNNNMPTWTKSINECLSQKVLTEMIWWFCSTGAGHV